jgi:hypothetical protein
MIREGNKNEDNLKKDKEKDDSHHSQQYDVDDDLENFLVKVARKDSDDLSHSLLSGQKNPKEQFIRTRHNRGFDIKNILNIISLILLFSTCLSPLLYYTIIEENVYEFYDLFKTNTIHLQMKFEVFLTCWIIIILTLFISLLRHCFYFTSDINEIFFITKFKYFKLNHNFYIGNFLSVISLNILLFQKNFSQKYGVSAILSFLSCIFYFLVYLEIKKEKFPVNKFLNYLGFNTSISFIFAWANYLLGTSICIFLEIAEEITAENSETIGFIIQGVICLVSIVVIVYYRDPFYVIFLLIIQIGLASASDEKKSSYENDLNIIFTVFTAICLIFGVFLMKRGNEEEERENVLRNYKIEKSRSEVL